METQLQNLVQPKHQWQVLEIVGSKSDIELDFASFGDYVIMVYPSAKKVRATAKYAAEQGFTNICFDIPGP